MEEKAINELMSDRDDAAYNALCYLEKIKNPSHNVIKAIDELLMDKDDSAYNALCILEGLCAPFDEDVFR